MPVNVLRVADRGAGSAIERLTNDYHARRLGKLGRAAQRTPPDDGRLWAAGDPPPRAANALDVLIDGAAYFRALEQAIRCARRSVLIAGWCITPEFALVRDEPPLLLRELLGEAAESVDVRVLLWAGAPVPVFAPRWGSVRKGRDELVRGTRIKAALDSNERPMHCHHEKLVVIDDEVAFVGGIDLTDLSGDRYDTPEHPGRGRMGWHDVASRLRGPVVADVARHVAHRWQAVTGERLEERPADLESAGDVELQIVRTLPETCYDFAPRGDFRIIEAYLRALRSAQRTPPEDGRLWAAGDPPPRAGNALDVLIEGAAYFPALEQAIRGARRSVLIAGWCITPGFALVRDEPPVLLRELLGEAAESVAVRVLLWAGAPVPVFAPRRASVRKGRDELVRGTRIKAALDSNERPMHCHHEKLVVIDDELAFVGGIDLTDLIGDR